MKIVVLAFVGGSLLAGAGVRAATNAVPLQQTTEIVDLLKSHYVDRDKLDSKTVDAATLAGVLKALGRGAQILTADELAAHKTKTAATPVVRGKLARAEIIQPDIGYVRVSDVVAETVPALDQELEKYAEAKVTGYVLDLRFADGTNYEAAAAVASRFISGGTELFMLKQAKGAAQVFRTATAQKPPTFDLSAAPLMLLVNHQTRGSAEALAGALRAQDRGIVVGSRTAGLPVATDDLKLADGRFLEVVTAKITLPKGGELFPDGLTPDVPVKIDPTVENDVVLHAQTNLTLTASLQPKEAKRNISEAELVKAFRGEAGENGNGTNGTTAASAEVRKVRDVVLQRAVDILKGIRVLQSWR